MIGTALFASGLTLMSIYFDISNPVAIYLLGCVISGVFIGVKHFGISWFKEFFNGCND